MRGEDASLRGVIGRADLCELLARAFAFPDGALATAVLDGALEADCRGCLADMGCAMPGDEGDGLGGDAGACAAGGPGDGAGVCDAAGVDGGLHGDGDANAPVAEDVGFGADGAMSVDELRARMGREYSRLYLNLACPLIYPYESAFLHVASGAQGKPALFRTRVTLDVEAQMREAGVAAADGRVEPCDSIADEFAFLSYLYGSLAAAMHAGDEGAQDLWRGRIERFLGDHVLAWLPGCMLMTAERTREGIYRRLARVALALLDNLRCSPDAVGAEKGALPSEKEGFR